MVGAQILGALFGLMVGTYFQRQSVYDEVDLVWTWDWVPDLAVVENPLQ